MFSTNNLLRNLILLVILLIGLTAVILAIIPITEQVKRVKGIIVSDKKPFIYKSERLYEVEKVHIGIEDTVKKGDLLIELRDPKLDNDIKSIRTKIDSTNEKILLLKEKVKLLEKKVINDIRLKKKEQELYNAEESVATLKESTAKTKTKIISTASTLASELKQKIEQFDKKKLSIIERINLLSRINSTLIELENNKLTVSNAQFNDNINKVQYEIKLARMEKDKIQTELQLSDFKIHLNGLKETRLALNIELDTFLEKRKHLTIYARESGKIVYLLPNLEQTNVVYKNQKLFSIQPNDYQLLAELALTDSQFKDTKVGQNANLEIWAWNHYKHGVVTGEIKKLSSHKIITEQFSKPHYIAYVKMDKTDIDLQVGYNLTANIDSGTTNLFHFIMKKFKF